MAYPASASLICSLRVAWMRSVLGLPRGSGGQAPTKRHFRVVRVGLGLPTAVSMPAARLSPGRLSHQTAISIAPWCWRPGAGPVSTVRTAPATCPCLRTPSLSPRCGPAVHPPRVARYTTRLLCTSPRRFRVVTARQLHAAFASDRSHMRPEGKWLSLPPSYPPLQPPAARDDDDVAGTTGITPRCSDPFMPVGVRDGRAPCGNHCNVAARG